VRLEWRKKSREEGGRKVESRGEERRGRKERMKSGGREVKESGVRSG